MESHRLVNRLADEGLAVVAISAYWPQAMSVADRILMGKRGKTVEEVRATEATEERMLFTAAPWSAVASMGAATVGCDYGAGVAFAAPLSRSGRRRASNPPSIRRCCA